MRFGQTVPEIKRFFENVNNFKPDDKHFLQPVGVCMANIKQKWYELKYNTEKWDKSLVRAFNFKNIPQLGPGNMLIAELNA